MQKIPSKKNRLLRQVFVYAVMTISVIIITTFIIFFVLGFRFNAVDGRIEQYAFLQYASDPSGSAVWVDGQYIGSNTPTKNSIQSGKHDFMMTKTGYKSWNKSLDVKAGIITWLNYVLLVPDQLTVESVRKYESLYDSLASPNNKSVIVQYLANEPNFEIVDTNSDSNTVKKITINSTFYSQANVKGVKHTFNVMTWDEGGRYVLIKHAYGNSFEWLVLDTQDANRTINASKLFNMNFSSITFSGTSGNTLYALESSDIRKLDLTAETISKPLVSNVESFSLYDSNIIAYVEKAATASGLVSVGVYREGDSVAHTLRTAKAKDNVMQIAVTHYFNENYIAISENKTVDILSGSYPSGSNGDISGLKSVASFELRDVALGLSFSPTGQYLLAWSGSHYNSYDLEYQSLVSYEIDGNSSIFNVKWLNDNYLWSDRDNVLKIREFDGVNVEKINDVTTGQDALITSNGRYIYSFNKTTTGYQLQRVRMILP